MHTVVTINLNGQAYQFDEDAYDALRAYLDRAGVQLKENPDRLEILADLEQAIADKCHRYLNAHKNVIAAVEIGLVLEEMGPVEGTSAQQATPPTDTPPPNAERPKSGTAPRRLYRIEDGMMIGGVCTGLAAFFGVDVTLVRVVFAILAALELASSHVGIVLIAYFVMMVVVPLASTSEEQAAAHGVRFNAQEVIDQAKRNLAELNDRGWQRQRREWRRQQRQWTKQWRHTMRAGRWGLAPPSADYGTRVAAGVMTSLLSVANLALFLVFLYALISLLSTSTIYTWHVPPDVPLWVATFGLFFTYYVVAWPLHMARRASLYAVSGSMYGWDAGGYGLVSAGLAALFIWLGYQYVPEVRQFVDRLPEIWQNVLRAFAQAR